MERVSDGFVKTPIESIMYKRTDFRVGFIFLNCFYCSWKTCFLLNIFQNCSQMIPQQIWVLFFLKCLNVVCKTTKNEITVEMFSAAFRCRQSIFDLETNIKPWVFVRSRGWAQKALSLFSFVDNIPLYFLGPGVSAW